MADQQPTSGGSATASQRDYARAAIQEMLGTTGKELAERQEAAATSPWVEILYRRFREDAQKNNDRIYTATEIFMPLSVAPLAALVVGIEEPSLFQVVLLGISSVGLMMANVLLARRERDVRKVYNQWVFGIQSEIGFDDSNFDTGSGPTTDKIRLGFLIGLTLVWVLAGIGQIRGWL